MAAKPKNSPWPGSSTTTSCWSSSTVVTRTLPDTMNVGPATRFAHLVDPLARREFLQFNLFGQDGEFFVIQQGKQRDVFQFFRIAGMAHLVLKLGVA